MPTAFFRLYVDDAAATRDQLDSVEMITVEQEMDMAWEARLDIPVCTSEDGSWSGETSALLVRARRVRVEIRVGDGSWTPLIDGPVVRVDTAMSPDPGASTATLVVSDDSVGLARDDDQTRFDSLLDHEVAQQLFQGAPQIASTDIETTSSPGGGTQLVVVQRGTAMDLLKMLAERNGMHAFVRPGDSSGASVGVFRKLPTRGDGIPDLVLLGPSRNLTRWESSDDGEQAATVTAHGLDPSAKTTSTSQSGLDDLTLLGSKKPVGPGAQPVRRILAACQSTANPQDRATAVADRASYAVSARGEVMNDCYDGVLTPYRVVAVRGVDGRQSGDYVVRQVTHSLGRSLYTQSFALQRNARSGGANAPAISAPTGIF